MTTVNVQITPQPGEEPEYRDGVVHVEHRSDGTLVIRTGSAKEFIQPEEYVRYTVGV